MKREKIGKPGGALAIALFCLALLPAAAGAFYLDEKQTLEFVGKAQTRASIRLNDAEGFTSPDVSAGDLVQHRNLVLIEVDHNLEYLREHLDVLFPLRLLGLNAKYHLAARFLYEGIYDYGPEMFQRARERDPENFDEFKQSYDLWELYADLSRGPFFVRLGKQNLAWGETDIFRLLDYINPLDNTFGGPFEDLDDRRMPLWMIRSSYNLGTIGPVSTLTIEGFWVPGQLDAHVSPLTPAGSPYAPPAPASPLAMRVLTPEREMSSSRWGARVMGILGGGLNVALAHYSTFLDTPAARVAVTPDLPALLSPTDAWQELSWPDVQITGASVNYWESPLDVVIRSELAWFWNEPVFIPEENLKLSDTNIPLPPALLDLVS
ncbi:MAG: DUF1302 family protein, partial [bacterium]